LTIRDETLIKLTAIICLTVICSLALLKGIDSILVGSVSAVIGGIAGYELGKIVVAKKEKEEEEK
jgi:membrane protein YqaA with SNARE-associated domain